jgi:hypothetical protein
MLTTRISGTEIINRLQALISAKSKTRIVTLQLSGAILCIDGRVDACGGPWRTAIIIFRGLIIDVVLLVSRLPQLIDLLIDEFNT